MVTNELVVYYMSDVILACTWVASIAKDHFNYVLKIKLLFIWCNFKRIDMSSGLQVLWNRHQGNYTVQEQACCHTWDTGHSWLKMTSSRRSSCSDIHPVTGGPRACGIHDEVLLDHEHVCTPPTLLPLSLPIVWQISIMSMKYHLLLSMKTDILVHA